MIRGVKRQKLYIDKITTAAIVSETIKTDLNDKLIRIMKEYLTREVDQVTVLRNLKNLGGEVKSA